MSKIIRQYHLQFSDRHFSQIRRVFIAILLAAITITSFILLRHLITPVVISIFLAYMIAPLVDTVENRGLSRTWAVAIITFSLLLLIGVTISLIWQDALAELQHLLAGAQLDNPEQLTASIKENLRAAFPGFAQSDFFDKMAERGVAYVESFANSMMEGFLAALSSAGEMIIIPFLIFFILKDARTLKKFIVQRIPNRYFEMSLSVIHKATLQLGRFIRGQLLDATIVGILAMIALSLLDLRYALLIGALAGLANMIPFLGPIVGGIPAIVISIVDTGGFSGVLPIVIAFAVIKLIDDVIVQPTVVSKSVELHPVVVIIAIFAGGHLGGILGMIVAVPLVSIIKETLSILHWGFSNYYLFGPPPYAVEESETTVEVLPEPVAGLPAATTASANPSTPEIKKPASAIQPNSIPTPPPQREVASAGLPKRPPRHSKKN